MAKQQHGINDGCLGSVGTVVGYKWRGKWCLRARPVHVANPRTSRQVAARSLFAECVRLSGCMKQALRWGLRERSLREGMTECNLFYRINRDCFTQGDSGLEVRWAALCVADGPVAPVASVETTVDAGGVATARFADDVHHLGGSADDEVRLYAYCPAMRAGVMAAPPVRAVRAVQLALPVLWAGCEVHFYLWAADYRGRASSSCFAGTVAFRDATAAG